MTDLTSDKRYNSILKIIDEHLLPDSVAKKERGEVFTPPELVREMLYGLKKSALEKGEYKIWGVDDHGNFTEDKESDRIGGIPTEIWQNPESTFLDPANGIGNFPVIAFYKLDYELQKLPKFKNTKARHKHIIEKMLYMIELDKGNCQTCRAIFKKICPEAKPNICCKDTLSVDGKILQKIFGVTQFDIVMGNPPFQKGQDKNFYVEFINFGISILKNSNKSFLVFVIPNRILIPNHAANDSILKINPFFMIHTINNRYFNTIATKICGVVANNIPYKHNTICVFNNDIYDIDLNEPTPSGVDDKRSKIISDKILLNNKNTLEYSKTAPKQNSVFIRRQWARYSPLDGNNKTHVFQEIIDNSAKTDGVYYLPTSDLNKSMLSWYLTRSQVIRFITLLYASGMNVPPFLWNKIPQISLHEKSDKDVYKKIGLSESDIDYINKILKEGKYYVKKDSKTRKNKGGSGQFRYTIKNRKF